MANNGEDTINLAKAGKLSLAEIESTFSTTGNNLVTVSDWDACYDAGTNQLSEFATVTSNSGSNPITGIGMLLYSANGQQLYAAQYTNNFQSAVIATSVGTTLYTTSDGNQALCIVYGWTNQGSFYFTQVMTIGSC